MESPLIEKDWAELGAANKSLDYYFAELRTTVLDSYTSALYRVPGKKIEVEQMCMRIRNLLKDKDDDTKPLQADLVAISLCKDDLELLNKSLVDLTNNNISFEHATLGIDKVGFDDLRSQVITRLNSFSKHLKEQEEQSKTIAATYSKSVKN